MSKETFEALEQALRDHIHDERGTYLTDFIICTASVAGDELDATRYDFSSSRIPFHSALGLLDTAIMHIKGELGDEDLDDD